MAYAQDHDSFLIDHDRTLEVVRSTIDGDDPRWVLTVAHGGLRITVPLTDGDALRLEDALRSIRRRKFAVVST